MKRTKLLQACSLLWCATTAITAPPAWSTTPPTPPARSDDDEARLRVEKVAAELAANMAQLCPVADSGDQAAFDACRKGLFMDSQFKRSLREVVLWGRQKDPKLTIKESKLSQFGPDVLSGMYVP